MKSKMKHKQPRSKAPVVPKYPSGTSGRSGRVVTVYPTLLANTIHMLLTGKAMALAKGISFEPYNPIAELGGL